MMAGNLSSYDLTLYHMNPTRSLRVLWACLELGLDVKVEHVALMQGAQFEPEFKAINPMTAVPALTMTHRVSGEQTTITESGAIVQFLAECGEDCEVLAPNRADVRARAMYHRWCTFAIAAMDPLLWTVRVHEDLLGESDALPKAAMQARDEFTNKIVPVLVDAIDTESGWILADFTAADILVGYALFWATKYDLVKHPKLRDYLDRCMNRDAFVAAKSHKASTNEAIENLPGSIAANRQL